MDSKPDEEISNELEFENVPEENVSDKKKPESKNDIDGLPEVIVEGFDLVQKVAFVAANKVSAFSTQERRDAKKAIRYYNMVEDGLISHKPTEYEKDLIERVNDLDEQEKNIGLTKDEKKNLSKYLGEWMRTKKMNTDNPASALWLYLSFILLVRIIPVLTNFMGRIMNKKDKPKAEFGEVIMVETESSKKRAA